MPRIDLDKIRVARSGADRPRKLELATTVIDQLEALRVRLEGGIADLTTARQHLVDLARGGLQAAVELKATLEGALSSTPTRPKRRR